MVEGRVSEDDLARGVFLLVLTYVRSDFPGHHWYF